MVDRRTFIAAAAALPVAVPGVTAQPAETTLRERAAARGFLFGAAAAWPTLRDDADYAAHFAAECNILVPENVLKMQLVQPRPGVFDFAAADFMAGFCRQHKLQFRGHTLVWHSQLAPWFKSEVTGDNARRIFEDHIRTVAAHYRGRMHSWDVVNEAIQVRDGLENGLRKTPWLELVGPQYIDIAFRTAHEADPGAMLVYNDYGLDYDDPADEAKRQAVLKLLRGMLERKVPLHGFGTQAHLNAANLKKINAGVLRGFFSAVAKLGLKILITELDVIDRDLPDDIAVRDKAVADVYDAYLSAAFSEKAVVAALTWGLTDKYTWLARRNPRASGLPVRPLPLDREYQRKPAWRAIARVIEAKRA